MSLSIEQLSLEKIKAKNTKYKLSQNGDKFRVQKGLIGPEILILDSLTQTLIRLNPSFGEHG